MDELWQQAFDDTHEGGTISHRFAALLFAEPAPVQPVPLTDVQKRPPNCGTGYCSCVECVMEPAAQPAQQEPEIVQRVKRYAGQTMRTARNPNITARECIELANWIVTTQPAAQPAQQEPINVAQAYAMAQVCLDLHDALGCKWGDNPYLAIDRLKTAAPASWMEMVTANLVREGVNKHKARELAGHFYGLAAPIPDAITDNSESPEFRSGWNECRELTIQMRKS
jgi:hypothetical protein